VASKAIPATFISIMGLYAVDEERIGLANY